MSRSVVFKSYEQDQMSLLSPSCDDMTPKNHPVRIVNIHLGPFGHQFAGEGLQRRWHFELSPADVAESDCLRLLAQPLFIAMNRTGAPRKRALYVTQRPKQARPQHHQRF